METLAKINELAEEFDRLRDLKIEQMKKEPDLNTRTGISMEVFRLDYAREGLSRILPSDVQI